MIPQEQKFSPELPPRRETAVETGPQQPEARPEQAVERQNAVETQTETAIPVSIQPSAPARTYQLKKSVTLQRIEHVMEEGLKQAYAEMPAESQKKFRETGEKTAQEIETLLHKVKVQTKKIFQLLFYWLKIIPGINQFFLEQEAKIKTDEILRLKEEMTKQNKI